jgi:hypothetical protein
MTDPSLYSAEAQVVTFYSYKGGVGRSMVAASVAVTLARWGYRVLCVDWDLEAPGLGLYLNNIRELRSHPGLVEFFTEVGEGSPPNWREFTQTVSEEQGLLDFIGAGEAGPAYVKRLQNLDFDRLYAGGLGETLEDLRASWKLTYDVVVIDSRTGISDMGGICTVQLPDILVLCFTANNQSLTGALDVAQRSIEGRHALPTDRTRPLVLPLLTRLETSVEYELMQTWITTANERVRSVVQDWLPQGLSLEDLSPFLRVPYVPRWSFGERLPVLEEDAADPQSISYSLETIAAILGRGLEGTDLLVSNRPLFIETAVRDKSSDRASGRFAADVLVISAKDDVVFARQVAQHLRHRAFAVEMLTLDGAETLREASTRGRHLVFVVGDRMPASADTEARQLILDLVASDTERLLIPISIAASPDAVPIPLRSFRVVSGLDRPAHEVADELSKILRPAGPHDPTTVRRDPRLLLRTSEALGRFKDIVRERGLEDRYRNGFWTAAYEIFTPAQPLSLTKLRDALMASVGRETGWPVWWWPQTADARPRIVENGIECLLANGTFSDPSHSDYWRASPDPVLFLLRGYEDDGQKQFDPGTRLDFLLPIWRTGECLLHASRFAANIGFRAAPVTFRMTWEGLHARHLSSWANERYFAPDATRVAEENSVSSEIETRADRIQDQLPELVQLLLQPLYLVFDFFEVPMQTIEAELAEMQKRS